MRYILFPSLLFYSFATFANPPLSQDEEVVFSTLTPSIESYTQTEKEQIASEFLTFSPEYRVKIIRRMDSMTDQSNKKLSAQETLSLFASIKGMLRYQERVTSARTLLQSTNIKSQDIEALIPFFARFNSTGHFVLVQSFNRISTGRNKKEIGSYLDLYQSIAEFNERNLEDALRYMKYWGFLDKNMHLAWRHRALILLRGVRLEHLSDISTTVRRSIPSNLPSRERYKMLEEIVASMFPKSIDL